MRLGGLWKDILFSINELNLLFFKIDMQRLQSNQFILFMLIMNYFRYWKLTSQREWQIWWLIQLYGLLVRPWILLSPENMGDIKKCKLIYANTSAQSTEANGTGSQGEHSEALCWVIVSYGFSFVKRRSESKIWSYTERIEEKKTRRIHEDLYLPQVVTLFIAIKLNTK